MHVREMHWQSLVSVVDTALPGIIITTVMSKL